MTSISSLLTSSEVTEAVDFWSSCRKFFHNSLAISHKFFFWHSSSHQCSRHWLYRSSQCSMRNELSCKADWWSSSKNFFINKAYLWNQPDFAGFESVEAQTQAKPTTAWPLIITHACYYPACEVSASPNTAVGGPLRNLYQEFREDLASKDLQ